MKRASGETGFVAQFALLPDGTSHVQRTVLNATAKQLIVTTTSSNGRRLATPGDPCREPERTAINGALRRAL